ncbi:hypothetical protein NHP21005_15320 [Helicobacter sp. NHP21005]|nr:hypothetical protein NHP21005_15320 [Helicobacter sp. NHP21005]
MFDTKSPGFFHLFLSPLAPHLQALDYKISGRVGSFSRIGFNNAPINTDKGLYPTGSYVTTIGALEVNANLLPKSVENQKLEVGLGGEIGGLAYDSTRGLRDQNGVLQPANWYYMGRWEGYLMNAPWRHVREEDESHAKNYILYNAYLSYTYKDIFGIKAGRYLSPEALFLRGYNQGFTLFLHLVIQA